MSPCGKYIAVVTWTLDDDVYGVSRAPYSELILWKLFQPPTPERTIKQIIAGEYPETPEVLWVCFAKANLYDLALSPKEHPTIDVLSNPPITDLQSYIAWDANSGFILFTQVIDLDDGEGNNNINGRVTSTSMQPSKETKLDNLDDISMISNESVVMSKYLINYLPLSSLETYDSNVIEFENLLRKQGDLVNLNFNGDKVEGIRVLSLSSSVSSYRSPYILVWSFNRMHILDMNKQGLVGGGGGWDTFWNEDIGSHGPFIGVDAVYCSKLLPATATITEATVTATATAAVDIAKKNHSTYLVSSLDVNGTIRFAAFPTDVQSTNERYPYRTVSPHHTTCSIHIYIYIYI
jgi:hypothetical protein